MEALSSIKPSSKVFIDGSNVFYTQKKLGWSIDWVKFKDHLTPTRDVLELRYYTGLKNGDEAMTAYLKYLKAIGFTCLTKPLKQIRVDQNTLKANPSTGFIYKANFDVEIAVDISLDKSEANEIILFSGDSDFKYLVDQLKGRNQKVTVVASKKTISWELKLSANEIIYLEDIKDKIIRINKTRR